MLAKPALPLASQSLLLAVESGIVLSLVFSTPESLTLQTPMARKCRHNDYIGSHAEETGRQVSSH